MTAEETLMDAEERMEKAISHLGDSLSGIRTGRATPGLVDSIKVEVYAYVTTRTVPDFLVVQEELMLRIIELVDQAGSGFAFPSQTTYIARDTTAADGATPHRPDRIAMPSAQSLPFPEWIS